MYTLHEPQIDIIRNIHPIDLSFHSQKVLTTFYIIPRRSHKSTKTLFTPVNGTVLNLFESSRTSCATEHNGEVRLHNPRALLSLTSLWNWGQLVNAKRCLEYKFSTYSPNSKPFKPYPR